ncbi:MAG: type II restriction endonuclease [Candidatus Gastranaerophilales bacterium]|nr:type II restriction endonuclease [Candidatus Gastranaerophilales bacterium]
MSHGLLRKCFNGVAVKRLSAVEVDPSRSHQHELNGVNGLKEILGPEKRCNIPTIFVWLGDEQDGITEEGFLTWYDARSNHPTRSEYRLYFPSTAVLNLASAGDPVFIATRPDGSIMVIITKAGSTMENQLLWLFDLPNLPESDGEITQTNQKFDVKQINYDVSGQTDFAVRYILEELGLEPEEPETDYLDLMLSRFGSNFPRTIEFSSFARETIPDVSPKDDPDGTLLSWINQEELLFRRLERHVVADRLEKGFIDTEGADINGFLKFSLSVQNRRKSRAGLSLENHLEEIFKIIDIPYARGKITENRQKPDFLFPGVVEYHNPQFPASKLIMLGAKSTCKDRWRQVLSEAARIKTKHLLTLEPGISQNQTTEMRSSSLQLVLPRELHQTYRPEQQSWLIDLNGFIDLVKKRAG